MNLLSIQFAGEEQLWHDRDGFDLGARRIAVPGLSAQHPHIFSTLDGEVCQVTTTMGCKLSM